MRLEEVSLVAYLQAVWQVSILLKLDLLGHGADHEWLGVAEGELAEEALVLTHALALVNLVDFIGRRTPLINPVL